jgi:hypothetical protein
MPLVVYKRPAYRLMSHHGPTVNVCRAGLFFNRRACELVGLDENSVRWALLLYDEDNPFRFGVRIFKTNRESAKEHSRDLYKVTYREFSHTGKINPTFFMKEYRLLEKALGVGNTTFPLLLDTTQPHDSMSFYFVIKKDEPLTESGQEE